MKHEETTGAGAPPFEQGVGRPVPERDLFDYEPGDEDWLDDECHYCRGSGTDRYADNLLTCPFCDGSGTA